METNPTISMVEQQIKESLAEVEDLLPLLGHSQAKRLLVMALKYPMDEADTSSEDEAFIKAYSAAKRITDGLVALGVETVIEQMVKNQIEQQEQEKENVEK